MGIDRRPVRRRAEADMREPARAVRQPDDVVQHLLPALRTSEWLLNVS